MRKTLGPAQAHGYAADRTDRLHNARQRDGLKSPIDAANDLAREILSAIKKRRADELKQAHTA
jgi:hypothetical protein